MSRQFSLISTVNTEGQQVALYYFNAAMSSLIRFLFILCIYFMCLVRADGPAVVASTYTEKNLDFLDVGSEVVILNFDFDQDIFYKQECPQRAQDPPIEPTIILPCCNSTLTQNCYTAQAQNADCFDASADREEIFTFPQGINSRYEFQVANPATCHSVMFGTKMDYGILNIKMFTRLNNYLNGGTPDFYTAFIGANSIFVCCSKIRTYNPAWDGKLYVRVEPSTDAKWTSQLLNSPIVSATDYFHTNRLEIHCANGYNYTRCIPQLTGGCWPLAPAQDDPPYYFLNMASQPQGEIIGRRFALSLALTTSSFVSGTSSTTLYILNRDVLDPSNQCYVHFPHLVNSNGEPALPTPFPAEKRENCSQTAFSTRLDGFLTQINDLSEKFNGTTPQMVVQDFVALLANTWSKEWTSCISFISKDLLETSVEPEEFIDSTFCPFFDPTDPRYLYDPCCNVRQQELECCRVRDLNVDDYHSTIVSADAVTQQCKRPKCVTETINDYLALQQSTADRITGCTAQSAKTIGSAVLTQTVGCSNNLFETTCLASSDCTTVCTSGGFCAVPCTTDDDCLSGSCSLTAEIDGKNVSICRMINALDINNVPFARINAQFLQCIEKTVDPVLFSYIKTLVGASPSDDVYKIADLVLKLAGDETCFGLGDFLFKPLSILTNITTQETCDSSQSCNWAPCDSNANSNCNNITCTEAVGSDYFCGYCLYDQCIEISSFPVCKYQALPSEQNCTYFNGLYNGLNPTYPKCLKPSTGVSDCYPPSFCEQSNAPCSPVCYVPVYTNAATCDGQAVGSQVASFKAWTRDGVSYGLCTVPVTTLDDCLNLSPDTRFWPGTEFAEDSTAQTIFNSEATCKFAGMCNLDITNLANLEFDTLSQYVKAVGTCSSNCNRPPTPCANCTTAESCDANGYCNQNVGCFAPFSDEWADSPCPEGTVWTAIGCIFDPSVIGSPAECVSPNVWHGPATTREECENVKVCVEPAIITALTFTTKDLSARPNSISFKNESECTKCGGRINPYWTWTAGEWRPGQFVQFEWRKREMKTVNKWTKLIDSTKAQQIVNQVISRRYADVLSSEMLCRYGQLQSAASEIVCDCASDGTNCTTSVASIRDPPVALIQFCTYAQFNQTFSRGYLYAENPTTDLGCAPVRVGVVPISQFNSRQTITLSSVSLSSARDAQDGQERFYKNSNNIVVGEVLGDGLSIDFLGREIRGVKACIFFPDPTTSRLPGITKFSIFSIDRTASGLHITVNETYNASEGYHCVDLTGLTVGKTFFTIALVDSWQDTLFSSTLTEGELALIAIGIVLYLIALFASIYHFAVSIMTRDPAKPLLTQSRVALGLLIIFLLIRVLYLLLFVTGTFKNSQSADVIFSELPALVFLNIYCIIVLRWAALYHFGLKDGAKKSFSRLKPVLYAFDALLGAAFITLLIVYFSLSDQITITCESSDIDVHSATPKQIVAIVYKAFFAVVCIILSIAFLVYGSRIIRSSTSFTARSLDRAEQRAIKKRKQDVLNKIVITVVCTLCLLGQAANLLRASATNEPGIYILIFLYPIELLPSIMFIIILKKVPFFYRASLFSGKKLLNINRSSWRQSTNQKKRNTVYGNMNAKLMSEEEEDENAVPMSETFQDESNIAFSEVKIAQEIGTGNYGKVNLGTWKGSQVALKRSKAFERTEFVREAKLVMTLPPHQNVVRTLGLTNDGFNLMLVMEYCNGGSLDVKLFDLPDPVSDQEKLAILIGIAQGMLHLHQNKIIHRDLAARNIIINNNVPKVADFGLSRKVEDILRNSTTRNNVGPLRWMAPEALRDGTYSAKTDVWSFGVVMFEVLAQSEPHVEEDPLFIGIKIRDGAFFPRLPAASTNDQVLRNLMEQCCRKEPNDRPDFNNICHVLVNRWNELYGKV